MALMGRQRAQLLHPTTQFSGPHETFLLPEPFGLEANLRGASLTG